MAQEDFPWPPMSVSVKQEGHCPIIPVSRIFKFSGKMCQRCVFQSQCTHVVRSECFKSFDRAAKMTRVPPQEICFLQDASLCGSCTVISDCVLRSNSTLGLCWA